MVGVAGTVVIVRLVGAAGARSAGAAMVPARPLEEGLVLSRGGVFSIAQPEIQISLVRPR